ncbi:helix-turn-helix domain-containing protein [Maribacter sp. ACAM166]|uniref:helix-turn-helix domain-containing protein n=1 Tax=Maribacter sp. ACAM166 TaxID=2508996 RepID=UPI0010FF0478|nr:AraC family transcriptional regulator [Maribacter sp. ACAM166]TLP74106.1 helix-turn-helix transcriptional regulator [Maribacter sp. ACAM166]
MIKDYFVKNMVCDRCIKVLRDELMEHNLKLLEIELGRLRLYIESESEFEKLEAIFKNNGFLLLETPEHKLIEKVKIELIKMLQSIPLNLNKKLSVYLEEKLNRDYSMISRIFSATEHITIEKYFIKLKIEKVKELIQNKENNFTMIGQLLDYSHINHLSSQFKNETGMSLSEYKLRQNNSRNSLDKIM